MALASGGYPEGLTLQFFFYAALFLIGSIIMRGAGCVMNDLWDRDLDKMVERTKNRPIASGSVSPKSALFFLITLLITGFVILIQFNFTTIALGAATIPLIATYPLMKRITWWPQAFLGLTFNFSALMGWSAITGTIELATIMLYLGCIFWTIGYDTIYAHQDKEDDIMAGIKSTARLFGKYSKYWVSAFYTLSMSCLLIALLLTNGISITAMMLLPAASHMAWQIITWKTNDQKSALTVFKSNQITGILIFIALITA